MRMKKRLLSILLTLAMLLALLPGLSLTALADSYYLCPEGHSGLTYSEDNYMFYCSECECYYSDYELTEVYIFRVCPYCGSTNFEKIDDWQYMCFNDDCPGDGEGYTFFSEPHTHIWAYRAYETNQITIYCGEDGCPIEDRLSNTLTLSAPTDRICDGSPKEATLSSTNEELTSGVEIIYMPGGNNAPSTAGTYTASCTLQDVTASVTFTLFESDPAPVSYMAWDAASQSLAAKTGDDACKSYTVVGANTTVWGEAGKTTWYVVNQNVTINSRVSTSGTVNLILCDGCTLNAKKGVTVANVTTLNIYEGWTGTRAQTPVVGALTTDNLYDDIHNNVDYFSAGIGGYNDKWRCDCGTINIHGGTVTAIGGNRAAGIGAGVYRDDDDTTDFRKGTAGTITIYGGTVTGQGGKTSSSGIVEELGQGAGIGGCNGGDGGTITIYGGNVNGIGGGWGGAGIGGGYAGGSGTIAIYGGAVEGSSGYSNAHKAGGDGIGKGVGGSSDGTLILGPGVKMETSDYTNWTDVTSTPEVRTRWMRTSWSSVPITGLTLAPSDEQTIGVGDSAAFTANVTPDGATDKKIKWSVSGTNASAVTLYSDAACTVGNEIGTDAVTNLTVYAKGISAGSATITATSNADSTKATSCNVTVVALDPVSYMAWDSTQSKLVEKTGENACTSYKVVKNSTGDVTWGTSGVTTWYVLPEDATISGKVTVIGNVNLILCDDATLTASSASGIAVDSGNSLTVYGQSGDSGVLDAGGTISVGGAMTIDGGSLIASGDVGISLQSDASVFNINSGTVTASGTSGGIISQGTFTINNDLQVKAGASETENTLYSGLTTFSGKDDTENYYKWVSIGIFHTHDFGSSYTLSQDGATITATCANTDGNCQLDDGTDDHKHIATLTIAAPTEGGGAATVTGNMRDFGVSAANVRYSTKSGSEWVNETSEAPSGDGFFKASITVSDGAETPTTYTAAVAYGVNAIIKGSITGEGCDFTVPVVATANATVTISTTPATGYELNGLTVTKADNGTIAVTIDGNNGSFTMPAENVTVSAEFRKINYTISFSETSNGSVSASKGGNPVSETNPANYQDTITLIATPNTGFLLNTLTVKDGKNVDVTLSGEGNTRTFTMPASGVTVSATFEGAPFAIITVCDPTNGGTVVVSGDGVATAENETTAKAGSEVTLTATPAAGFELGSVTVTKASGGAVTVTDGKFTMPTEAVTATATFTARDVGVTLTVTGSDGTPCGAALLDDAYQEIDGTFTRKAGETFILCATTDEDYDYSIQFNGSAETAVANLAVFSDEENQAYAQYLNNNGLTAPAQTELFRVTMPGVAEGDLEIAVTFGKVKAFTALYQSTAAVADTDTVWCKFTDSQGQVYAAEMMNGLNLDGVSVWSVSLKSAFTPSQIAFVTVSKDADDETLKAAVDGVTNLTACSAQTNTAWKDIGSDKYMVIGGNAKAVIAAFADGDDAQIEVGACITDAQGNVTSAGSVKAPAAPDKTGFTFGGWRGFQYDANGKASEKIYAAGDSVPIRTNTTLAAVWEPIVPIVILDPKNGDENINMDATYGEVVHKPEDIEKIGFILENWKVGKSVTENGKFFFRGSPFDFSTGITDNLELNAQWKHVHSYTCVPLNFPAFNGALDEYSEYFPYVHVRICGCFDIKLEAHTFQNGVCTQCGYEQPGATEVQLQVSYWKDGASSPWLEEAPRTVKKNEEVNVAAFVQIGTNAFSKWQYSTDNGTTWKDLAASSMVGFIIPCSTQVRAVYVSTILEPQIDLSARSYVTEAQGYNWDTVLFQMHYKLPDGYTFVDAGVRMGDNEGISYYEMKEYKQSAAKKATDVGFSFGFNMIPFVGGGLSGFATEQTMNLISGDDPQYYYEKRENSVLDEMTAATLSEYMFKFKPINASEYPPVYWETKAQTKSQCGTVNTLTPLRFIQKNNGNHFIYGMAYLTYKDSTGVQHTIYTDAIPVTRNQPTGTAANTHTLAN